MTFTAMVRDGRRHNTAVKDTAVVVAVWLIIASQIILQRFAIGNVPLSFVSAFMVIIILMITGAITIDRILLFYLMGATLLSSIFFFFWRSDISYNSYLYLLSILALYMLRFRDPEISYQLAQRFFLNIMYISGIIGIAQFSGQFIVGHELLFPLEWLPEEVLLSGYNTIIPLSYGSDIIKSNGVFFLEPSFFAQFLALALILELLNRQRAVRCGIYALALLSSYSGTGMLMVVVMLPFVLAKRIKMPIVFAAAVLFFVAILSMSILEFDSVINRVGEFDTPESSGFARFISPFYLIRDFLIPSPINLLYGMGPGTIESALEKAPFHGYLAHDPTWIKLIFEYGLIGGLGFITYVLCAMYSGSRNWIFTTALLLTWLFLGGYLLSGLINMMLVSLGSLHSRPRKHSDQ